VDRGVKTGRPPQEAARQARTRHTRAAVVEAARSLFVDHGYAATTIESISERSDTPQATVYRLFASKLGILKAVLDVYIGGDDEAVAMLDRPRVRALVSDEVQTSPEGPQALMHGDTAASDRSARRAGESVAGAPQ
jgi:AcrR family transcriptional regulator